MSVFGRIMSAIFGQGANAATPAAGTEAQAPAGGATTGAAPSSPQGPGGGKMEAVDVSAVLEGLAAKSKEKLDWKHSIVDLMKLLDIDSSLAARKELAKELNYDGDMGDSATMNMWLHKQVLRKLAENGGKVPADLKD